MARTVVITQPTYLPWLGYFEQVARADVFVFLDSVQFARRSWQCRNRIEPERHGQQRWLTVPVEGQPRATSIADIRIAVQDPHWGRAHLSAIRARLARAPHFDGVYAMLEPILTAPHAHLADLNIALIQRIAGMLDLHPQFVRSSQLPVHGAKGDLMLAILRHLGATEYYVSAGSADYLEALRPQFDAAGITLTYQQWPHPVYPQGDAPFASHLSVIDALAWIGPDAVAELVTHHLTARAT